MTAVGAAGRCAVCGGPVSAPIFKRIAEATLRYLGIGPSINPPVPVLVAGDGPKEPTQGIAEDPPIVRLVAETGTMPDLSGMTAREALRTLVKLGMTARLSGDGVVVEQEPAAGSPIEGEAISRLVLERSPVRRAVAEHR